MCRELSENQAVGRALLPGIGGYSELPLAHTGSLSGKSARPTAGCRFSCFTTAEYIKKQKAV
ncbi:hypothetical protein BG910_06740 [Neisseria chenwenguii]|uniref:Uncharacterized protein n=1 Tax=Neisseria chenwenguii TaxID=1853278 RepID=A0A220S1W8_9NEIS|nr:hypothetical protein BG910_06740 [Neisseria chenwenguii]ROV54075.1 hypothetical protein EGS38_11520 [Neisseria chenwenguii]